MEFGRQTSEGDLLFYFAKFQQKVGEKRKNAKCLSLHLIINYTFSFRDKKIR